MRLSAFAVDARRGLPATKAIWNIPWDCAMGPFGAFVLRNKWRLLIGTQVSFTLVLMARRKWIIDQNKLPTPEQ